MIFKNISRQLYRLRDKQYAARPQTGEEIQEKLRTPEVFEEYGKTLNKQHPLYVDSVIEDGYSFHVFASFATIELIQQHVPPGERKYLMDGTFKIIPRQFTRSGQLLIIAIEYKNDVRILKTTIELEKNVDCVSVYWKFDLDQIEKNLFVLLLDE